MEWETEARLIELWGGVAAVVPRWRVDDRDVRNPPSTNHCIRVLPLVSTCGMAIHKGHRSCQAMGDVAALGQPLHETDDCRRVQTSRQLSPGVAVVREPAIHRLSKQIAAPLDNIFARRTLNELCSEG